MKSCFVLLSCLFVAACSNFLTRPDPEFLAVARVAVSKVEARPYEPPSGELTYVVPASIAPEARKALASIRKVVSPNDVPTSAEASFPSGYFKVEKFQVSGSTALFEGTQGPIYSSNPLSCGLGISLPLSNEGGTWRVHTVRWTQC